MVLVIEGNEGVRNVLGLMLERTGLPFLLAKDAVQALSLAKNTQLDILLADVTSLNGEVHELAETLRSQNPKLREVFMITGGEDQRQIPPKHEQVLAKPFTTQSLIDRLNGP